MGAERGVREFVSLDGPHLNLSAICVMALFLSAHEPRRTRIREEMVRFPGTDFMDTPQGRSNTALSRLRGKFIQLDQHLLVRSSRSEATGGSAHRSRKHSSSPDPSREMHPMRRFSVGMTQRSHVF